MKMSKRIASLLITVIMLLGMMTVFASAADASIKLKNWNRNDVFNFEYTGANEGSWVGIYLASETPSDGTPAIMWKSVDAGSGEAMIANGAINGNQDGKGGAKYSDAYTNLLPGDYKICLFKDGGYEVIASEKFTVRQYDVKKDGTSTYLSDLQWVSFVNYRNTSDDLKSDSNPDGLTLEAMGGNRPFLDAQNGAFDPTANGYTYYPSDTALVSTINVGGLYYEKGISIAIRKITDVDEMKEFKGNKEKYAEIVYDISNLDVNNFSCVFGKNYLGQKGNNIGGCEILADDKVIYTSPAEQMEKKDAVEVKCEIPAGTKQLTLRAYSTSQTHADGGVAFADAKLYKTGSASTYDMGIAVSAIALVVAASAAAVALSKKH